MGRRDKPIPEGDFESLPLGAKMRRARHEKGVGLRKLADRLAYSVGHLSTVENGIGRPSQDLVDAYERELGLFPGMLTAGGESSEAVADSRPHRIATRETLVGPQALTPRTPAQPGIRFGGGFRLGRVKTRHSDSRTDTLRAILGEIDELDRRVRDLRQMVAELIDGDEVEP